MPTITIDGKRCEFEGKPTILQVALENGIEIPHYCYHPGLSIVANCRICLAEVAQPDPRNEGKLSLIPKLLPTCQTPAVDGSEVYTTSEKSVANQKTVMEYLLINHPLDCPVCDQAGECKLQDYSYQYGRAASRFEENKQKNPKKDVGTNVLLYADRCIMCTRCVRFTREVTGTGELCVSGRGHKEEIDTFPGKALDNPLSVNVVDICPVGALLDKDFLFEQRVWFLSSAPGIDGYTASGDNLWIDHNEGRVWRFKPRTNLEINKWWTSDEIRYSWKHVHSEARLRKPMVKRDGAQVEVNWNDALARALEGMSGKKLALLVSPMLTCEDAHELGQALQTLDEGVIVGVGPVPFEGEDQAFPGGYTVYAEKAPNARGVRRALEGVFGEGHVHDEAAWRQHVNAADAVLVTGNYPSDWVTEPVRAILSGKFTVVCDTLPNALTADADVLLPASAWVEKAGTFENVHHRLQSFERAIQPVEFTRPEAQVALDLLAAAGKADPARYAAAATRARMGAPFADAAQPAVDAKARTSEMAYVEI